MFSKIKTNKGFTLIELLVVISIIGILSSIVISSLNAARAKSRDAQRLSDLNQLQRALEAYAIDNGSYPSTGGSINWWGSCSAGGSRGTSGSNGWIPNLAPTYIPVLPLDPRPTGAWYCYLYTSNGIDYMLLANYTVESYTSINNPKLRPRSTDHPTFAIYTEGAKMW